MSDEIADHVGTVANSSTDSTQVVLAQLIGADRCGALGITVQGSAPVLALCRELISAGFDPARSLRCYRGAVLALSVRSIGEAARLRVAAHGVGFERHWECTGGPWVRQNGKRGS